MTEPTKTRGRVTTPALKTLTFSIAGLLIGIGLCGLDAHLYPGSTLGGSFLSVLGAGVIALSALGTSISVLCLLVLGIAGLLRK